MQEQINRALQEFAQNPGAYGFTLLELIRKDREAFYRGSLAALHTGEDSPGHKYLITLLVQNGLLVGDLPNPAYFSKEVSISLARKIAAIEPRLDTKLARMLPNRDGPGDSRTERECAERILDLLEATSTGARIVPLITHLMQCSDERLRARAALMIGRRLQNARSTEVLLKEPDPRVRANAVESLWGNDTPSARVLLWQALKDPNNRVAGNAMFGLYGLQEAGIIPYILEMARETKAELRMTAAWTMGETADPRFLPALEKLSHDLYATVRNRATAAIALVRRAEEAAAAAAPQFSLHALRVEKLPNGARSVWIWVEAPDGAFAGGLPSTAFVLSEDRREVIDYQVCERHITERIGVGFALCAEPSTDLGDLSAAAQAAVTSCLRYRRATDFWAVSKMGSDDQSAPFSWHDTKGRLEGIEAPRYVVNQEIIKHTLSADATRSRVRPAALEAFRMLLRDIGSVRGQRHIIVLAGPEVAAAADLDLAAKAAITHHVAVHAIVTGGPQPAVESLCRKTGGTAVPAAGPENLENAYRKVYLGLIARYELSYRPQSRASGTAAPAEGAGDVHLRIFSQAGCGECNLRLP